MKTKKSKFDRFLDRGLIYLSIFVPMIYLALFTKTKQFETVFQYFLIAIVVIAFIGIITILYLHFNLKKIQSSLNKYHEKVDEYIGKRHFTALDRLLNENQNSEIWLFIFGKLLNSIRTNRDKIQSENELFDFLEKKKDRAVVKKFLILLFVNTSPVLYILFNIIYFRLRLFPPNSYPPEAILHISLVMICLIVISVISIFFYNRFAARYESVLSTTSDLILRYFKVKNNK